MTDGTGNTSNQDSDSTADSAEQVEPLPDDPGGMPFDDEFVDDEEPGASPTRGAAPYDSGKVLTARGIKYPSSTPTGMKELKKFTMGRWGGGDLGTLSKPPRTFRGGSSPSLHNWGMAWDWRWANPGRGRATADEAIQFFLDRADVLGIQAIHDYAGGRYWKSYRGWRDGTPSTSTGMGQRWAQWLHIERTWAWANDARSITQILGEAGKPAPAGSSKESALPGKVVLPDPEMVLGHRGANVARLQDFLRYFEYASFTRSDGEFGPKTKGAVENARATSPASSSTPGKIDGEYGPKSAAAAAKVITTL